MLRSLALISLVAGSFVGFGCSNNDTPIKYPPVLTPDMAGDGTGGNGGSGGSGGGGGANGGDDMGTAGGHDMGPVMPDLGGLPAPDHSPTEHPPLPTMSAFSANSTIKAPEVWTVVWKGDDALGDKVNTFNTWMLGSDYWKNGLKDYGAGAGTAKGKIVLTTTPPPATISDATLQSIITQNIGVTAGWPTKNANTIISFVLDPKTTVTNGAHKGCVDFDGYHARTATGKVPYLVNAYCNDAMGNPDWNNLTVTMSHEAAEATCDYDLGHNKVLDSSTGQAYLGGGENGDLCLSLNTSIAADATNTYLVQRLWSNSVAVANNADPCIPVDAGQKWFGAGLVSGNADPSIINVGLDTSGKGTQPFKIEAFEMDPTFGPIGFYIIGSLLPAGVTISPNIAIATDAQGNQTGAVQYLNAGGTFNGTVNVSSAYQADGQPITLLIISRNATRTHYNIWWGVLLIN